MKFNFYVLYILFTVFTFIFSEQASAQMPPVQWGTYYGGSQGDFGNSVATDKEGNVYLAGHTRSPLGIATAGAQWPNLGPNASSTVYNGFVVKFNSSGVRQWGTYVPEEVNDIACDDNGNVYITGKANNATLINISTVGSHQTVSGGEEDAFLMKFNSSGVLQWATYYGGTKKDFGNSIAVDIYNDIYITGTTISDEGIATPGTHKSTKAETINKIFFLAKFNSSGVRQWGTYYGDESINEDFDNSNESYSINVTTDIKRNVYICGTTESMLGIATGGSHQPNKIGGAGNRDVFVAKLTPDGNRIWGTYYGGTNDDWAANIICDLAGNIYFSGLTNSITGIATPGAPQSAYQVGSPSYDLNMMLVKFTPNVSGTNATRTWGTYYGKRSKIISNLTTRGMSGGLAIDPAGLIYLAGANDAKEQADAFSGFNATLSRYETTTGIKRGDTTIGAPGAFDFGAAVAVDPSGNVFLAGSTASDVMIATPGSAQPARGNTGLVTTDAFLIKFKNADTTVYFKDLHLLPTTFCPGDTFYVPYGVTHPFKAGNVFTVQLYNTGAFLDIGSRAATDSGRIRCIIPDPITFPNYPRIRIIASNPLDTTVVNALLDTISQRPEFTLLADTVVCQGVLVNLRIILTTSPTGVKYAWTGPQSFAATTASTSVDPTTPDKTGHYVATVTAGGCKVKDSVFVKIKPRPDIPQILVDSVICENDTLFLWAQSSLPQAGYHWNGPNGVSFGVATQKAYIAKVPRNGTGLYYVAAGIEECYSDTISAFVRVKPAPDFGSFIISPDTICEGDTLRIIPFTNATDSIYSWIGPNGFTSTDTNVVIPNVPYDNRGTYKITAYTNGCRGEAWTSFIDVHPKPRFMATSNSPLYEGEDLKLDIVDEMFPGATFRWLGPAGFRDSVRSPIRDSVDPDRHSGNYHVTAKSEWGCEYVGITNVIIYKLNFDEFILYPIPNNGNFTVRGTAKTNLPINVEVVNSANQLIGYEMIYPQGRRFLKEFWLEDNLANGQYYFRAKVNGKWKVVPFTIAK